jgi:hypothetical protein
MQVSGAGGGTGAAMIQQMRDRLLTRADGDGNGRLSLEEFHTLAKKPPAGGPAEAAGTRAMDAAFKALDADGDGQLTTAELARARRHHQGQAEMGGPDSLAVLLGAQEHAATGGGLRGVLARAMEAYGAGARAAA